MDDSSVDRDLFAVLRQLAIVSAALSHNPANRDELLRQREFLVQTAQRMGFGVSEGQLELLKERLGSEAATERPSVRGTTSHSKILAWALEHDAVPAEVRRPVFDHQPSALRFLSGAAKAGTPELRVISWETFFAQFDLMELALVFDDETDYEFCPAQPASGPPLN